MFSKHGSFIIVRGTSQNNFNPTYKWFNGFREEESKNIFSYGPLLKLCLKAEAILNFWISQETCILQRFIQGVLQLICFKWLGGFRHELFNNIFPYSQSYVKLVKEGDHLGFPTHTKSENKVYVIFQVQLKFYPVPSFKCLFHFLMGFYLKTLRCSGGHLWFPITYIILILYRVTYVVSQKRLEILANDHKA